MICIVHHEIVPFCTGAAWWIIALMMPLSAFYLHLIVPQFHYHEANQSVEDYQTKDNIGINIWLLLQN